MTAQKWGWRFDPYQERLQVALQPILNGVDLCFVNCDAYIVTTTMVEPYGDQY